MAKYKISAFVGAVFGFLGLLGTSTAMASDAIDPQGADRLLKGGRAVLIDIREKDEVAEGMAAPAQWLAMSEIQAESPKWQAFLKELKKDKEVILYCRSGRRASVIAPRFQRDGFKVRNMGGFSAWKSAGLPVKNCAADGC